MDSKKAQYEKEIELPSVKFKTLAECISKYSKAAKDAPIENEFFEERLNIYNERRKNWNQKAVAQRLGISLEFLRKKLYRQKHLRRDEVIAICAAYGFSSAQTNDALLASGFPSLVRELPKDSVIIQWLDNHAMEIYNPNLLNDYLNNNGQNVLECFNFARQPKQPLGSCQKYYPLCNIRIIGFGNIYEHSSSISSVYMPEYRCAAKLTLADCCNKIINLTVTEDNLAFIHEKSDDGLSISTVDVHNCGDYQFFIDAMVIEVKNELDRLLEISYDTKNYCGRFGANLKNDNIHVFYEQFNYSAPERNEYFLMELLDGTFLLSVSHKSMFMSEYLSSEQYQKYYPREQQAVRKVFACEEEIIAFVQQKRNSFEADIYSLYLDKYRELKELVQEKYLQIKNRDVFIQNIYELDYPCQILRFFNAEKEFNCIYDSEVDEISSYSDSATFYNSSGLACQISFDELTAAFEIGCQTIEQVIRIIEKYGSIRAIFSH